MSPSPEPLSACSPATLESVELPALLELLAGLAATDLGGERILALRPATTLEELKHRRELYGEAAALLSEGRLVPSMEEALRPLLDRLGSTQEGSPTDLLTIARLLRTTTDVAKRVERACLGETPPEALSDWVAELADLSSLGRRIEQVLDSRGRVRDEASPALVRLRKSVRTERDGLYKQLKATAEAYGADLAEETIPLRGGRLVLLLKASAKGPSKGLHHGSSATGRSLYFEPIEAVEGNNRLSDALEKEDAERTRLLAELVDTARASRVELEAHFDLVARLDLLQAAWDLASLSDGRLADLGDRASLRLTAARHPLLDPRLAALRGRTLGAEGHREEVVPLDLDLDETRRILVLTGPNAGGKTVALKTLGLTAVAHLCGLPVAAESGTRLPFFTGVVAAVGDDQDVLADRSTFSGRLQRLMEVWEAGPDALILIDELGTGTDPEEGAAMAVALVERLLTRGSLGLVTTHLARLAASALELEGASCAAMAFDDTTDEPTFRLVPGAPGTSEALALGRRLGLAAEWLERAEELLDPDHRKLQRLLAEVEATQRRLAEELATARLGRRELEARLTAAARKESEFEEERRRVASDLKAKLDAYRQEVRQRLGTEVERLKTEIERGRRKGLAAAAAERALASPPEEIEAVAEEEGAPLEIGSPVRHRTLLWEGVLQDLAERRAEVVVRGKRVRCRPEELTGIAAAEEVAPRRRPAAFEAVDEIPAELNLIGQRVEEAMEELDRYLDRALLSSRRRVRIVHGHGSGRLRSAVREHLLGHPAVGSFGPAPANRGGEGATTVVLEGA